MRSSPPGSTSATTAITLAVPMSRPTTRSLYSLAMLFPDVLFLRSVGGDRRGRDALQAHRVAVGVAQVGVFQRPLVARGRPACSVPTKRSVRATHLVVAAAAELDLGAAVELDAPRAAARQRERVDVLRPAVASTGCSRSSSASTWAALPSGPCSVGSASSSTSPRLASKTSPKLLTSLSASPSSPASSHSATGRCSSSRTSSRFGQTRRTTAWRTHGTDSKARRARAQVEREEVARQLRQRVGADRRRRCCARGRRRCGSRCTANSGWRASHVSAAAPAPARRSARARPRGVHQPDVGRQRAAAVPKRVSGHRVSRSRIGTAIGRMRPAARGRCGQPAVARESERRARAHAGSAGTAPRS